MNDEHIMSAEASYLDIEWKTKNKSFVFYRFVVQRSCNSSSVTRFAFAYKNCRCWTRRRRNEMQNWWKSFSVVQRNARKIKFGWLWNLFVLKLSWIFSLDRSFSAFLLCLLMTSFDESWMFSFDFTQNNWQTNNSIWKSFWMEQMKTIGRLHFIVLWSIWKCHRQSTLRNTPEIFVDFTSF